MKIKFWFRNPLKHKYFFGGSVYRDKKEIFHFDIAQLIDSFEQFFVGLEQAHDNHTDWTR